MAKSKVYDFFEKSVESDEYNCKVQRDNDGDRVCGIGISNSGKAGSKAANLKRHLERHHPTQYKVVCEADAEALEPKRKAARTVSTPPIHT